MRNFSLAVSVVFPRFCMMALGYGPRCDGARHFPQQKRGGVQLVREALQNPLIVGAAVAFAFVLTGLLQSKLLCSSPVFMPKTAVFFCAAAAGTACGKARFKGLFA